ncbi:MAG: shikimate kinase [Lachnospiraceae bacterium]|nr:shikimate kinase [Lachnospiraceae bacterium]
MPASGKSTVGVILAKVLGMEFVDSDLVIQKRESLKLSEIIETCGVEGFLRAEEEALLSIRAEGTVIATGGSAVYSEAGMNFLKQNATVVYLKVGLKPLKKRLHDIKGRGVVLRGGETFDEMYAERTALYEKYADVVVEEKNGSIEDTVWAVVAGGAR